MSRLRKTLVAVVLTLSLSLGGLAASGYDFTAYNLQFDEARWHTKVNNFMGAVAAGLNTLTSQVSALSSLITGWAVEDNMVVLVTATPTYFDADTFTVPGDYTSRLTAGKVIQAQVAAGLVYSTVASSVYNSGGFTVVNLNNAVLTDPITRVYVVATRDGLWPYGPGYVVARDYGTDRAALLAADTLAAAAGKQLLIGPYTWVITADTTLAARVKFMPGAILTNAGYTTKNLILNYPPDAGDYQIFAFTGTGKVTHPGEPKPPHWGMARDGVTDDSAAVQAAVVCAKDAGGKQSIDMRGLGAVALANSVSLYRYTTVTMGGPGTWFIPTGNNHCFVSAEDLGGSGQVDAVMQRLFDYVYFDFSGNSNNIDGIHLVHKVLNTKIENIVAYGKSTAQQRAVYHYTADVDTMTDAFEIDGGHFYSMNHPRGAVDMAAAGAATASDNNLMFRRLHWAGIYQTGGSVDLFKNMVLDDPKWEVAPQNPVLADGTGGKNFYFNFGNEGLTSTEAIYGGEIRRPWCELLGTTKVAFKGVVRSSAQYGPIHLVTPTPTTLDLETQVWILDRTNKYAATQDNTTTLVTTGVPPSGTFAPGYKLALVGADGQSYRSTVFSVAGAGGSPITIVLNDAVVPADLAYIVRFQDYYDNIAGHESLFDAYGSFKGYEVHGAAGVKIGKQGQLLKVVKTGTVTLAAGATTTVVADTAVTSNSQVFLMANTLHATVAAAFVRDADYDPGVGFTVHHVNDAETDKTFSYFLINK